MTAEHDVSAGRFSLELPTEPEQLAVLRSELRPWLSAHGLDERTAQDVLVATGEAASNAIEHPRDPRNQVFRVEGQVADGQLVIRVSDSGRWRQPSLPSERGRGLPFMRKLVSDVEVVESDGGTAVVLRQALPARAASR